MPPVSDTLRGERDEWSPKAIRVDSIDNQIVERTDCLPSLIGVKKISDNYSRVVLIALVFSTFICFWLRPPLFQSRTCNHPRINTCMHHALARLSGLTQRCNMSCRNSLFHMGGMSSPTREIVESSTFGYGDAAFHLLRLYKTAKAEASEYRDTGGTARCGLRIVTLETAAVIAPKNPSVIRSDDVQKWSRIYRLHNLPA